MLENLISLFFLSFAVAFSGAIMPGPVLAVVIHQTPRKGFWVSPLIIVGHSILEMVLIVAILVGLGELIALKNVKAGIGIAGGSILLWMAFGMLLSARKITLNIKNTPETTKDYNPIVAGVVTSISNPYWTFWWATIGLKLITDAKLFGPLGVSTFYVGHILGDFIWYAIIGLMLVLGKKFLTDTIYRIIIGICGSFLLGFGIYCFYGGISKLLASS